MSHTQNFMSHQGHQDSAVHTTTMTTTMTTTNPTDDFSAPRREVHAIFAKPSIVELNGKQFIAERLDIKGSRLFLDAEEFISTSTIKKIIVRAPHVLSVFANNVEIQFQNIHQVENASDTGGMLTVYGNVLSHVNNNRGPIACKSVTECRTTTGHVIQTSVDDLLSFDVAPEVICFTGDVLTFTGEKCVSCVLGWVNTIISQDWHLFLHGHVPFIDTKSGSISVENIGSACFVMTNVLMNNYAPVSTEPNDPSNDEVRRPPLSRVQFPLPRGGVHVKDFSRSGGK